MGSDGNGQFGISTSMMCGARPCSRYPLSVSGLSGTITQVSGGGFHSLAVKADGTAWAWGANGSGQLGNGSTQGSQAPVQVSTLSGVTSVVAGSIHSLALKSDGSVWAWGDNSAGQLGGGTTGGDATNPQAVKGVGGTGTLGGISAIGAGKAFSGALVGQTGTILTWGQGTSGQLGGGTANANLPIQGTSLMGQTSLALGSYHVLSLESTRQVTLTYGYDRLDRLTSGGTPGTPNAYTYDPNGNRLSVTQGNAAAVPSQYDGADRLTKVNLLAYTTDDDGNLTAYPGATLTYDQANRLKTYASGGTTTYAYDGDGKRASKTVGTTTTSYAYDANRSLPVVLTDGSLKYVWGVGLAYATDTSGTVQDVYHTDGLGSVRAITNASGAITETYQTDEFGVASLVQGTSSQPFQYTGEQRDTESGFVDLRARYYAPGLGRFLSRDRQAGSSADPGSLNRSTYVQDNPANLRDPSGLCTDPGGPGVRYCVDRYIPTATVGAPFLPGVQFVGDGRDPEANGGTYRVQQLLYQGLGGSLAQQSDAGVTTGLFPGGAQLSRRGDLTPCDASKSQILGGREIAATCGGTIGLSYGLAPAIWTDVVISESGGQTSVSAYGTVYPSLEVWQYGASTDPQLVFFYSASAAHTNPGAGLFEQQWLPNMVSPSPRST